MFDCGCIIFANDCGTYNYSKLAELAAARVKKYLGIPTHIINKTQSSNNTRVQGDSQIIWNNLDRLDAYAETRWLRTLVIDADFLINTDALLGHIHTSSHFSILKDIYDPATGNSYRLKLGASNIDLCWATAFVFDESQESFSIFEMAKHVIQNYEYYAKLYGFNTSPKRVDYAFTIACHVIGGYGSYDYGLQYQLPNLDSNVQVLEINDNSVKFQYKKQHNNETKNYIQRLYGDVHIQNKESLFGLI